ncbi:MAG TPA: OXA-2 family class D beta-lactamase, partial [Methylophaga sp.]|nr:OXA-2 family class D beta-lactamase [Methylophaga sp.]
MKIPVVSLLGFILLGCSNAFAQLNSEERPDWQTIFDNYAAQGTIVVLDERKDNAKLMVFNEPRSKQRLPPASTFKVPHALFALDAGVVKDEFQVFPWDGVERSFAIHNQDQ